MVPADVLGEGINGLDELGSALVVPNGELAAVLDIVEIVVVDFKQFQFRCRLVSA